MTAPSLEAPQHEIERELGLRGSFYWFVKNAWKQVDHDAFADNWHIDLICSLLERVQRREIMTLVIELPPGCMKSLLVQVFWPAWCWIRDPNDSFLNTSFDAKLTRRDAKKTMNLIQSDWFKERWGDRCYITPDAGATEHQTVQGGWRSTTSIGGRATGQHPKRKTVDDPTKPREVTREALEKAREYWKNTLASRGLPGLVTTVLIMQRLAVDDLAGYFEQQVDCHICRLPMRYETKDAYPDDPRTVEGELLWMSRMPEAAVRGLEVNMGSRVAAAQLQQRPFPDGGNIIKKSWIQWYQPHEAPALHSLTQSWDFAFKGEITSDRVAGQVWGMSEGKFYGVDGVCEQLDFVESVGAVKTLSVRNPDATAKLFEGKANGPAIKTSLEAEGVTGIIEIEPEGGKVARLYAVSPLVEAGNIFLPVGQPWAEALAESLAAFPVGPWDDDVDAFTQAINYLRTKSVDYDAAMAAAGEVGLFS